MTIQKITRLLKECKSRILSLDDREKQLEAVRNINELRIDYMSKEYCDIEICYVLSYFVRDILEEIYK